MVGVGNSFYFTDVRPHAAHKLNGSPTLFDILKPQSRARVNSLVFFISGGEGVGTQTVLVFSTKPPDTSKGCSGHSNG